MPESITNVIFNVVSKPLAFFGTDGMLLKYNQAWTMLCEEQTSSSPILFYEDFRTAFILPPLNENQLQDSAITHYGKKALRVLRRNIAVRNGNGILVEIDDISSSHTVMQQSERIVADAMWKIRSRIATIQNVFTLLVDYEHQLFDVETLRLLVSSRWELLDLERQAENLRYLLQTDTGQVTFVPFLEECNIRQHIENTLLQLEPLLSSFVQRPEIRIDIDPLLTIVTDRQILLKALSALLCNALFYNDHTAPIEFSSTVDNNYTRVSLRDHGWGIAHDEQQSIFSYTFRGTRAKHSTYSGLGIELYLIRRLLLLVNTNIEFTSSEHNGSQFTILFKR